MSKVPDPNARDGREAFHLATMAVYADLGALIAILQKEPDLQDALLALDSIAEHRAPEPGDPELIVTLKHVVGHLLESLNTVEDVRKKHPRVGSAFWRGLGIDRTWEAISSASYHEVAIGAAEAMLEPDAAGAAQSGRKAPAGGASGIIRQKVIDAALDAESWARLAENLEHEYRSASLLPNPPTDELKRAAGPIEEVQTPHPEEVDFAEAMERYDRSCDEMRTVRLNPGKVIPVDQWRKTAQRRGSVIVREQDWKRYVRYVIRVAGRNERHADQARLWWSWWEKTQLDPSTAGLAPLVSPGIEVALRIAAKQRGAGSPTVGGALADDASAPPDEGRPGEQADRFVTVEEAALALGTPEKTVRNWINKRDKLKPVDRLGGPRKAAARYRLGDISARKPDRS